MSENEDYKKGMSLGWRLCFILSLFATIPRLIFVWESTGFKVHWAMAVASLLIQFILSFEFAWIFLFLCLNYTYQISSWFNRQKTFVQTGLALILFLGLNEILFQLKIAMDKDNSDITIFRVVYYLYNFLVVLAILGYRNFLMASQAYYRIGLENEQLKREQIKAQLEALRNQLNPHFLFNALNILNISIFSNPDLAQKIVLDLSDILRYNLKVQNQSLVLLSDEMAAAKSYLDLYKARFGEKLLFYFEDIDPTKQWFIIPLSLQLLIENAIKHNVITTNQVLFIEIKLNEEDKSLIVKNSVNKKHNVVGTGIGLVNLDRRYKIQTGEIPSHQEKDEQFTVKVPLIEAP